MQKFEVANKNYLIPPFDKHEVNQTNILSNTFGTPPDSTLAKIIPIKLLES